MSTKIQIPALTDGVVSDDGWHVEDAPNEGMTRTRIERYDGETFRTVAHFELYAQQSHVRIDQWVSEHGWIRIHAAGRDKVRAVLNISITRYNEEMGLLFDAVRYTGIWIAVPGAEIDVIEH